MPWAHRSLSRRIALLVLALLVVIGGGIAVIAYVQVERSLRQTAGDRLLAVGHQLVASLARPPREATARLTRLARDPAVIAAATATPPGAAPAATSLLQQAVPADQRSVVALVDSAGGPIIQVGPPGKPAWFGTAAAPAARAPRVGPYARLNDSVLYYDVRAPVRREGVIVGAVVQRIRLTLSPAAPGTLAWLLGASTSLVLGTPATGLWTDLGRMVAPPPPAALRPEDVARFTWSGTSYLGVSMPITGTPFILIVRAPTAEVMAPALAYRRDVLALVAVMLLLGVLAAGRLGRWLSRPIVEMTNVAGRIAAGDATPRANERAPDEVGRLAQSFNTMVDQVARSTEHLRESEARYRLLAENAQDIVSLRDRTGRTLYVSPSAATLLAYSEAEIQFKPMESMVHPDDVETVQRARAEVLRPDGSGTATSTHRMRRGNGTWLWMETLYRRMPLPPGQGPGILAASRDITERKCLVQQVQQSQKLEAVGRLAGGVAHDFNNLLTAILGELYTANEMLPEDHPARKPHEGIGFAARRAAVLTAQLLTFSRHQVTQPRLLDLNAVLAALDRMLERVIGEDISLVTHFAPGLPPVRADEAQIGQVVLNLVVNARDAMPNGGTLTIETRIIDLDEDYARTHAGVLPGRYALLAVTDTGGGMSPEVAAHIFEPFFTTKDVGKGTGLGLATCFGIVTEAGGHLWFYTEPGHGTTFKVYLPIVAGTIVPDAAEQAPADPRGTETILLVEDEPAVRSVTTRLLRSLGYTVLEAHHGEAALALASSTAQPIHLVVTDMVMPHLGGRAMIDRMREHRPEVRVLFISGYAADAITRNGSLEPGMAFLQKPFTRPGLAKAVRDALER